MRVLGLWRVRRLFAPFLGVYAFTWVSVGSGCHKRNVSKLHDKCHGDQNSKQLPANLSLRAVDKLSWEPTKGLRGVVHHFGLRVAISVFCHRIAPTILTVSVEDPKRENHGCVCVCGVKSGRWFFLFLDRWPGCRYIYCHVGYWEFTLKFAVSG